MKKIIIGVDGMRSGVCESVVNDSVRGVDGVVKVRSSCTRNLTEVIAEDSVDAKAVAEAIDGQGYRVMAYRCEPYERKRIFGLFGGKK